MQDFHFFSEYYPGARYLQKSAIPNMLCKKIQKQNLLIELGCGIGENLNLYKSAGFGGQIVAYDLCLRYEKPKTQGITLIEGDVRQTLMPQDRPIDILYVDLDADPEATRFALRQLSQQINNSWIYIDEFLRGDAIVFAQWLLEVYYDFSIYGYTEHGALIKLGQGQTADHLILSLEQYSQVPQ